MSLLRFCFLIFILASCKTVQLFPERDYSSGGNLFKIRPDNTFEYRETTHGRVHKFSRGTWKQEGNRLLLFNKVSDAKELPLEVKTSPASGAGIDLVVNVLPRQNILPGVLETFNVDMIVNSTVYPLKNETNLVHFDQPLENVYFKAYKKVSGPDPGYTILNDTLRSQTLSVKETGKILVVDLDCNPLHFAKVKMPDDTLQIINDAKLKWGKIYLTRSH